MSEKSALPEQFWSELERVGGAQVDHVAAHALYESCGWAPGEILNVAAQFGPANPMGLVHAVSVVQSAQQAGLGRPAVEGIVSVVNKNVSSSVARLLQAGKGSVEWSDVAWLVDLSFAQGINLLDYAAGYLRIEGAQGSDLHQLVGKGITLPVVYEAVRFGTLSRDEILAAGSNEEITAAVEKKEHQLDEAVGIRQGTTSATKQRRRVYRTTQPITPGKKAIPPRTV